MGLTSILAANNRIAEVVPRGLRWRVVGVEIPLPLSPYFMEILNPLEVVFLF
jgi:hypothetical protein